MNDYIQLKKDNILRIGIKDSNGNPTGEHLEFDMEDIEIPIRINQCEFEHRKNQRELQEKYIIIDKKQDVKGKGILSRNEREKMNVLKEYYRKEEKALDLFLGEGGTRKLLNGRKPFYTMYEEFSEVLEPIMDKLELRVEDIKKKIASKYSTKKEDNTLE